MTATELRRKRSDGAVPRTEPASVPAPVSEVPQAKPSWLHGSRRWIPAAFVAVAFVVLVLPVNKALSFQAPTDRQGIAVETALTLAFAVALCAFVGWALEFVHRVRTDRPGYRRWAIASGVHLVVLLPILLLIYPGHWVWDEYGTLAVARTYSLDAWQGYFTTVYYTFSLFLLPSPIALVIVQVLVLVLIAGYTVSTTARLLRHPRLAWLMLLPFVALPALLYSFYPLRLTLYAGLLVLLLVQLISLRVAPLPTAAARRARFLALTALITVLAFWRSEGVYLLVLVPVLFLAFRLHREMRGGARVTAATAIAAIVIVGAGGLITSKTSDGRYQLSATINPLSTMLQHPLQGPNVTADLAAINRIVDVQVLREHPDYYESPALWTGVKPGQSDQFGAYYRAFADLVVHNPGPFAENRWRTLVAANGMDPAWTPQVQAGGLTGSGDAATAFAGFVAGNAWVQPLNPELRLATIRTLLLADSAGRLTWAAPIVWNALPVAALLLAALIVLIVRRRWFWAGIAALVLANGVLVAATEPASYFMYFFPLQLAGSAMLLLMAIRVLDRGRPGRARRTEEASA